MACRLAICRALLARQSERPAHWMNLVREVRGNPKRLVPARPIGKLHTSATTIISADDYGLCPGSVSLVASPCMESVR